ncbi:MAG: DUF2254 domain-containing protein [Chitinophagales bacterium]|nr:DUF2254 domain-containing protein [Chitinophagales bacterium]
MKSKIKYFWFLLKGSFWFLPIVIIGLSQGAAVLMIYLDTTFNYQPEGFIRYFFLDSVDSARSVLSIIAAAMIGVAGTVFSITLVALTLASSQFGSRLLRNFMYDRLNQVVLGTYVSTFAYCIIILKTVRSESFTFTPNFSVLLAIFLALGNIILLIIFIHHISISIQADRVISDVGSELSRGIRRLFPVKMGEGKDENDLDRNALLTNLEYQYSLNCKKDGYLQSIDNESLIRSAKKNEVVVELNHRPGHYLVEGIQLLKVYSSKPVENEAIENLHDAFVYGDIRTPHQDAEFAIHQLVEIAARALSPGVNDPYTAIACIDKLTSSMGYLTKVSFPKSIRLDDDQEIRVLTSPSSFESMMDASFNQIRYFAVGSPAVLSKLMQSFVTINKLAETEEQKIAITRHVGRLLKAAENSVDDGYYIQEIKSLRKEYFEEE